MDAPDDPFEQLAPRSRALPRSVKVRIGVGAAAVLVIAAFGTAVLVGMLAPRGGSARIPAVSVTSTAGVGAPSTPSAHVVIYVHVLGAVARPGLYTVAAGSRVIDAVSAAGGMSDDAEQAGVNLAREVSDGEQLVVPHIGEPVQPPPGPAQGPGGSPIQGQKVNLNSATEEQLETLPRIGPAMAAKITAWRTQNGRFTSIDDLMNVSGIGQKTFEGLKDLVTV